jgi:heat shock protein HslJ
MKMIVAFAAVAALAACASPMAMDRDGSWELAALRGAPAGVPTPNLRIDDTQISGFAGCNRYVGQIESDPNVAAFFRGSLAVTQMYCEGAPMQIEQAFLEALAQTGDMRSVGDDLVVFDTQNREIMRFRRARP